MSNLTRLQAVSSSLDTAIGKANSLPNAGSGGGGGGGASVETCTVTITKPNRSARCSCFYTNSNLEVGQLTSSMALTDTVKVAKNTLVLLDHGMYDINLYGEYEAIYGGNAMSVSVFFVKGDVSVDVIEAEPS